MSLQIRDVQEQDLAQVLAINNEAVPNVNHLSIEDLRALQAMACYFRVAKQAEQLAGFLIGLRPSAHYNSPNFKWFQEQYDDFVYIDRVVVAADFRGMGIGRVFYADVQSYAEQIAPWLTCEVNLVPRNDVSLLFHGTYGFGEVGQQSTEQGKKRVSLLAKPLPAFEFVKNHYLRTP